MKVNRVPEGFWFYVLIGVGLVKMAGFIFILYLSVEAGRPRVFSFILLISAVAIGIIALAVWDNVRERGP